MTKESNDDNSGPVIDVTPNDVPHNAAPPLADPVPQAGPVPNGNEALINALNGKDRENRKLYKLVNTLKERNTNLEIELAERDVVIEDLQKLIGG